MNWPAVAWLLLATSAAGQKIEFKAVPQNLVESRLRAYTTKNNTREPALRRLFEDAGCNGDALVEQAVKGLKQPNLVCTHAGPGDSTIVVGAHFDLVEKGDGVVDNWSGAALLASLYEGLFNVERQHTYVFVAFAGEESGLVGSRAFVKQLGPGKKRVKAMVNLDTLGLSESKVWVSHADHTLVSLMSAVAASMKLPVSRLDVDKLGETDSESFRLQKIPAITIHSVSPEQFKILHSPLDKIEAIHLDEYYRTYQLVLGYLAALDQKLE